MEQPPSSAGAPDLPRPRAEDRLDSWKEIAAYLRRGVRTVRRWEKEEGLPVHRHLHRRLGAVYAYKTEIDAWWESRRVRLETEHENGGAAASVESASLASGRRGAIAAAAILAALAAASLLYWAWPAGEPAGGPPSRVMLAVLPFENLTGDGEQEYFSDGLTEELIAELGRLYPARLGVIARTSAMQYKGTPKGVGEIARELGVDYVVEGSVRREDDRVRVTAQLIRASDETHLWAQRYDRASDGPLTVQGDVARAVAQEVQLRLSERVAMPARAAERFGTEAREAYLKGRYFLERRTAGDIRIARGWFERAIALEPDYAAAFVGVAESHILAIAYADAPPAEAMEDARRAVQKALELDERLPAAHAALATIRTEYDWDWAGAEAEFRRAIELDPNYAHARRLNAEYLSYVGRFDEALAEARLARRLDPLSILANSMVGIVLYRARRFEEAIEPLKEALRLNARHPLPYLPLGLSYAQLARYDEAIASLERARELAADHSELLAQVGYVHARAGHVEKARAVLTELEALRTTRYVAPFHFAIVHSGLGDVDRAIEWLERGYEQRIWLLCVLKTDPIFDPLRSDQRFHRLLRRMNLSAPEA